MPIAHPLGQWSTDKRSSNYPETHDQNQQPQNYLQKQWWQKIQLITRRLRRISKSSPFSSHLSQTVLGVKHDDYACHPFGKLDSLIKIIRRMQKIGDTIQYALSYGRCLKHCSLSYYTTFVGICPERRFGAFTTNLFVGICPETCLGAFCSKCGFGSLQGAIWHGIFLLVPRKSWNVIHVSMCMVATSPGM